MSLFGAAKPATPPDVEVQNLQTESISSLSFSPTGKSLVPTFTATARLDNTLSVITADFLAVASWNNEVSTRFGRGCDALPELAMRGLSKRRARGSNNDD